MSIEYDEMKSSAQQNHIEIEMQSRSGLYIVPSSLTDSPNHLESILTKAFVSQPLLGDVKLLPSQREEKNT